MPRVEVVKNFATVPECAELNNWVKKGIQEKWLGFGISRGDHYYAGRLTSRMYGDRSNNPSVALAIQQRVCEYFGLSQHKTATLSGGNDGVVVSTTFAGGDVYEHRDPREQAPLSTLRCNLLTSAATNGCELYVVGNKVDFGEGDLVCYLVTDWPHRVTENLGEKPRNLWMFGWYVPFDDWESGRIGVQH